MNLSIKLIPSLFLIIGCANVYNNPLNNKEFESVEDKITKPKILKNNLIPKGYSLYERVGGDLNKDGVIDSIFIVKKIDKTNIIQHENRGELDRNRRGIMVFFNEKNQWVLGMKNMDCFSSENEEGGVYYAPELSVNIEKGNLYVNYHHGRYGHWTYTFRYQQGDFELIGYDASSNFGPIVEKEISINYLSKRQQVLENINEKTEESGDEVYKETWTDIEIEQLMKLSEIEDFDELYLLED